MWPDEPHAQHDPVSDGDDRQPNTVPQFPRFADSAGVTVPVEPQPRSNANTSAKKPRKQGNTRRTGHNLVVRGVRRDPPDIHKLAQVVASLAADMLEDEIGDDHSGLADADASDTATAAAQRKPRHAA